MSNSLNPWQEFLHTHGGQGYSREELVHMYHQQQGDPEYEGHSCPQGKHWRDAYVRSDGTHVAGECVSNPHFSKKEKSKCPPGHYWRQSHPGDGLPVTGECVKMPHYGSSDSSSGDPITEGHSCPAGKHWRSGYRYAHNGAYVPGECIDDPHFSKSKKAKCPPGQYMRRSHPGDGLPVTEECVNMPHYGSSDPPSESSSSGDPVTEGHSCPAGMHWRSGYRYAKNGAYVPGECIEDPHYSKSKKSKGDPVTEGHSCPAGKHWRSGYRYAHNGAYVPGECIDDPHFSKSKKAKCPPGEYWRDAHTYLGTPVAGECVRKPHYSSKKSDPSPKSKYLVRSPAKKNLKSLLSDPPSPYLSPPRINTSLKARYPTSPPRRPISPSRDPKNKPLIRSNAINYEPGSKMIKNRY